MERERKRLERRFVTNEIYFIFQNSQNFCLTWPLEHWFSIEYIGYKCRFRDRSILCSFFVDKRYISNNSWLSANSVSHNGLHCDTNAIRQPSPYMWPCNNVTMLRCSNTITNICIGPTSTPTWLMIVVVCTGWTSYDWKLILCDGCFSFWWVSLLFVLILHIIFQSK